MKKLSIKKKIILWFAVAIFVLVLCTSFVTLAISRNVLNQTIQERLMSIVNSNGEEIEYNNSMSSADKEAADFYIAYNGGILEIDDDFCNYYDGIYTALIDSENLLLYGQAPFALDDSDAFTFTSVGFVSHKGERFYIYEKRLTGEHLDGLWLRGFVSERESTHILYTVARLSLLLVPLFALAALIGGYIITRRSFLPIEKISRTAEAISMSGDLSQRIVLDDSVDGEASFDTDAGMAADKDELHQLARTFNRMFEQLERTFKAEKQFTSDASHELRTPLAVIQAQAEYALGYAGSSEDYIDALSVIKRQNERASALLSQLLFFTRLENRSTAFKLVDTDFSRLVTSVCDDRRILLGDGQRLDVSVEPDLHVMADENLMVRLLNNLLDNAYKYSSGDGACPKASVSVNLRALEDYAVLAVSDSGIGIAPENLDKIWNRFYQADSSRSDETSFGLGLAMVKEIADFHGGSIKVESVPGEGSCFTLTLPRI